MQEGAVLKVLLACSLHRVEEAYLVCERRTLLQVKGFKLQRIC